MPWCVQDEYLTYKYVVRLDEEDGMLFCYGGFREGRTTCVGARDGEMPSYPKVRCTNVQYCRRQASGDVSGVSYLAVSYFGLATFSIDSGVML
jgi:hypothetical protein